jgi:hypothetical protein
MSGVVLLSWVVFAPETRVNFSFCSSDELLIFLKFYCWMRLFVEFNSDISVMWFKNFKTEVLADLKNKIQKKQRIKCQPLQTKITPP